MQTTKAIYIVAIEPIETRYTKHWFEFMQPMLIKHVHPKVVQITGKSIPVGGNTPGAFLNFSGTVVWKSEQMINIAKKFQAGVINPGDIFLFTDYWNPAAHFVRYMSDLNGIPVKIAGIAHAGAWDPADILGQKFSSRSWSNYLEQSYDSLYDNIYFATNFSRQLYRQGTGIASSHQMVTGFPMEYYDEVMPCYWSREFLTRPKKEDIVVFPHRKSPEKHLDLFLAIAKTLPQYDFVVAMDVCKNKDDYHDLLSRSKLAFSASLQETLGISIGLEALRAGCDVMVPDRLSYAEMFSNAFKYQGSIASKETFTDVDVDYLSGLVRFHMSQRELRLPAIKDQYEHNYRTYFTGTWFYNALRELLKD